MVPAKSDPRWVELVSGKIAHEFSVFSGSMMISRLSRTISLDDSAKTIDKCVDEARAFFEKFESIFENDLNKIFN